MDTCSLACKLKRKRLNGRDDACSCKRSLNDLPDAILKLILSFLTTKCAVRTSVLCKRWQYMWTSLPNLDFNDRERMVLEQVAASEKRKLFKDFVDRVLIFHEASRVHNFTLCCDASDDMAHIRTWVSAAAARLKPQEIDITVHNARVNDHHLLPHCLFSCEVTEVMRLQGVFRLFLPSRICLPRLRILTLTGLTFKDHHPLNLLFGGPALEELVLQDCEWEGGKSEVTISAPKLKHLTIEETHELYRPTEHDSKSVTISAPEVEVFHYEGGLLKSYHFHCPSSITDATLESHDGLPIENLHIGHLSEVLSALQSVECLQLAAYFVKALTHASVPMFKNLIRLDLSEEQVDLSSKELEKLLNQCPRLETLTFLGGISTDYCVRHLLNSNLTCLSSTLKRVSISYFNGNTCELFAVQFLLWKGTCLEKMDVYCYEGGDAPKEIGLFLSACHRSSETCELYVG